MSYGADYHTHSNCSDGTLSPAELVKWAKEKELTLVALTDHDTVEGIEAFMIAGEALEMTVMPGIEVTAEENGVELHILGLDIDHKNENLLEICNENLQYRVDRNKILLDFIKEDFNIEPKEILEEYPKYLGKPQIGQYLVDKGLYNSVEEVFKQVYINQKYIDIPKKRIGAKKAIEVIKEAGGIAVWAHPAKTRGIGTKGSDEFWDNALKIGKTLKGYGLSGIEAISLKHSQEDRIESVNIAEKLHLHITQGSDFHGYR